MYILWNASGWPTFSHGVFSNVSSNCSTPRMHNHTGCICWTFLHCVFSNVSSKHLHKWMHIRTGCISLTFLQCASSNFSSNYLPVRMKNHIGCICLIFPYAHWQPFHSNSCAWNCHVQDLVPLQTDGKVGRPPAAVCLKLRKILISKFKM